MLYFLLNAHGWAAAYRLSSGHIQSIHPRTPSSIVVTIFQLENYQNQLGLPCLFIKWWCSAFFYHRSIYTLQTYQQANPRHSYIQWSYQITTWWDCEDGYFIVWSHSSMSRQSYFVIHNHNYSLHVSGWERHLKTYFLFKIIIKYFCYKTGILMLPVLYC